MCSENVIGTEEFASSEVVALNTEGIYRIGESAFRNSKLENVYIASSVREIENDAFYGSDIKTLKFAPGVRWIGDYAFSNIHTLEDVILPGTVCFLGEKVFSDTAYMASIEIQPGNLFRTGYSSFEKCMAKAITLPETVEIIDDWTFAYNHYLEWIKLPHSLKILGDYALFDCDKLKKISIPSVQTIGKYAFLNCSSLKEITFSEGVETIDQGAFGGCWSIDEIVFPASLRYISNCSFRGTRLKRIRFQGECDIYPGAFPFRMPEHIDSSTGFVFDLGAGKWPKRQT